MTCTEVIGARGEGLGVRDVAVLRKAESGNEFAARVESVSRDGVPRFAWMAHTKARGSYVTKAAMIDGQWLRCVRRASLGEAERLREEMPA